MQPGQVDRAEQMQVSLTEKPTAERYLAYARLYDLLSQAFAYPSAPFHAALQSKDFPGVLSDALGALPLTPALSTAHTALLSAVEAAGTHPLLQLESDYIALFDASREAPVLHPYARLYGEQALNPANLLPRLQEMYRGQGLVLDADNGAEQADHITVQLEFMALLFQRLAQAPDDAQAQQDAQAFRAQLAWLPRFVAALSERGTPHWLYQPLADFMLALYAGEPWSADA